MTLSPQNGLKTMPFVLSTKLQEFLKKGGGISFVSDESYKKYIYDEKKKSYKM
jgi:hypothetical protein